MLLNQILYVAAALANCLQCFYLFPIFCERLLFNQFPVASLEFLLLLSFEAHTIP